MKKLLICFFIFAFILFLTGCTTVYRDRYTVLEYDQTLTKDYDVPPPPLSAPAYSVMKCSDQESLWIDYTGDLLGIIGKNHADKAGLRKANEEFKKKIEELNKKAVSK